MARNRSETETSSKTHRDYELLLRRYVRPALGNRPVSKIEPLEIQHLYAEMQERGLSARTVRFTHAVLRAALHQAVKWRLIPQNPTESVDLPKQAKGEIQVLYPQQARDFLKETAEDRYHVLFAVAITTGMRPSEYLAPKWPDVNFSNGTVSVARTLEPIKGGGWRFADTKRPRSRRLVKASGVGRQVARRLSRCPGQRARRQRSRRCGGVSNLCEFERQPAE